MRAEDVNPEWVKAAWRGWEGTQHDEASSDDIMAAAIAAVAPLIAAAERERCARVAEKEVWCPCGGPPCQTPPGHGCGVQPANGEEIAAAIRALGDADG